jgi:hypothetical protein
MGIRDSDFEQDIEGHWGHIFTYDNGKVEKRGERNAHVKAEIRESRMRYFTFGVRCTSRMGFQHCVKSWEVVRMRI